MVFGMGVLLVCLANSGVVMGCVSFLFCLCVMSAMSDACDSMFIVAEDVEGVMLLVRSSSSILGHS